MCLTKFVKIYKNVNREHRIYAVGNVHKMIGNIEETRFWARGKEKNRIC